MALKISFIIFNFSLLLLSFGLSENKQPNILVFLVDDMGLMDTSLPFIINSEGKTEKQALNNFYRTPSMQRLAKQGIRFSRFYAMSVCSPTRLSLLTGQTSARHHTTQFIKPETNNAGAFGPPDWQWEGVSPDHVVLPKLMQQTGYQTIFCGKAHFGPVNSFGEKPEKFGFNINIAGCAYGQPGSYYGKENFGHGKKGKVNRAVPGLEKYHGQDIFLTEALTLEMNQAISNSVENQKPFFAYMSHYAVHAPFQSDSRFIDNYSSKNKNLNAFATLIEGMDKSLGDMMDHLEKLHVAEDTLILFLGDNGTDSPIGNPHNIACAAPLRGKKGTHYEGGMRVPFIAAWAKNNPENPFQKRMPIATGVISQQVGTVYDIVPTLLKLSGAKNPQNHALDGIDLSPHFTSSKSSLEREFLMHFPHEHRSSYFTSYLKGHWKLIYHYHHKEKDPWDSIELFDLSSDRDESKNLASSHPEKLNEMMEAMRISLDKSGAQYPYSKDKKNMIKPTL